MTCLQDNVELNQNEVSGNNSCLHFQLIVYFTCTDKLYTTFIMADYSGRMGTTDLEVRLFGPRSLCKYGGQQRKIDANMFHIFEVCTL